MGYVNSTALLNFLIYSGGSIALLGLFVRLYLWTTPYHEMTEIKAGKKAPAFALGGAMLGFTFPLLSMSFHGTNYADFMIWSALAGAFQLLLFKLLYRLVPMKIEADNQAVGVLYAFSAVCVGAINAFSLIPA